MIGDNFISKTQSLVDDILIFVETSPWKENYYFRLKTLSEEIKEPCVLAVSGKVKAGKSYLINSLLGVDLAITGTTETTATVNVFKKGKPLSKETPILCQWNNGQKEWKPISFLKSLQGTDEQTLEVTSKIDRLIFYIEDNPILDEVTLVDTPGIGAVVGADDDAHQVHTDSYFNLRESHHSQTVSLSNSADAILYLFNVVPEEIDKKFLYSLHDNGNGITSLNGIGVLSKIDMNDNILKDINTPKKYALEYQSILYDIQPVSAAIHKNIPSIETAIKVKEIISNGITSEKRLEFMLSSEGAFFQPEMKDCLLTVKQRKELLTLILGVSDTTCDYPWRTFVIILKELYHSSDIIMSIQKLAALSGIDTLRDMVYNVFFKRSKVLRCNKLLSETKKVLLNTLYDDYFCKMSRYASHKKACLSSCESLSEPYKSIIKDLIDRNISSNADIDDLKNNIKQYIDKIDTLMSELSIVNDDYNAIRLILQNRSQFSQDEINELEDLFNGNSTLHKYKQQQYWNGVINCTPPNSIRNTVAILAKKKYGLI